MTLKEINKLTLDNSLFDVLKRLIPNADYNIDGNTSLNWYERVMPKNFEMPSEIELEAELFEYKQELIDIENERLRKEDLKDRFFSMDDMRMAFHNLHEEPNPKVWFKELVELDADFAEVKIAELETRDAELKAERDSKKSEKDAAKLAIEQFKEMNSDAVKLKDLVDIVKAMM